MSIGAHANVHSITSARVVGEPKQRRIVIAPTAPEAHNYVMVYYNNF